MKVKVYEVRVDVKANINDIVNENEVGDEVPIL